MSVPAPLMVEIVASQNPGILASMGNPSSYVMAEGRRNKSSALFGSCPCPGLGPDSRGPVPVILGKQKSSAAFSSLKKVNPPSSYQYPHLEYSWHHLSLPLWP